ncbi:MAG: hypothetical protein ACTS6G_02610 [Candidatus Hodgkinia cicadicola]
MVDNKLEAKQRKDRAEDALKVAKLAVSDGVSAGGVIASLRILKASQASFT